MKTSSILVLFAARLLKLVSNESFVQGELLVGSKYFVQEAVQDCLQSQLVVELVAEQVVGTVVDLVAGKVADNAAEMVAALPVQIEAEDWGAPRSLLLLGFSI